MEFSLSPTGTYVYSHSPQRVRYVVCRLVLLRERKAVIKFEKQISEIAKCKWGCLVDKLENIFNKLFLTFSQEAETYLELVMDPCTWETIVVVTRVHKPITRSFSFVILHIYLFWQSYLSELTTIFVRFDNFSFVYIKTVSCQSNTSYFFNAKFDRLCYSMTS